MYNKVSAEMFKFHKTLISENYKSYYSEVDVKVLDGCRTNPPHGRFQHLDEEGWGKKNVALTEERLIHMRALGFFKFQSLKSLMFGDLMMKNATITNLEITHCIWLKPVKATCFSTKSSTWFMANI